LPCLSDSTGPTGSSRRARGAGTAPDGEANGGKSPRSQAGGGPTGGTQRVTNAVSEAARALGRGGRACRAAAGWRAARRDGARRAPRVGSEADASGAGAAPRSAGARVLVTGAGIQCRGTQEGRAADAGPPSWSTGPPSDPARRGGAPEIT